MKTYRSIIIGAVAFVGGVAMLLSAQGAAAALVGESNLGMHNMDSDYSVFSILPPYNTIEA
ncbi:MAG: hypothetical protein NT154_18770, partial [Verrucomicrobia bacterium]|nr:hypothetical protein [Verrucomicrobiota bacterium]